MLATREYTVEYRNLELQLTNLVEVSLQYKNTNSLIISFSSAACMHFLRYNLSLIFSYTHDIRMNWIRVITNVMLTNVSVYHIASKITLLQ